MPILKYYNEKLKIGMADWKTVYQFPQQESMIIELHQGNLYYRQLKKGLVRKQVVIDDSLPF